jgi:hypothetical protein
MNDLQEGILGLEGNETSTVRRRSMGYMLYAHCRIHVNFFSQFKAILKDHSWSQVTALVNRFKVEASASAHDWQLYTRDEFVPYWRYLVQSLYGSP